MKAVLMTATGGVDVLQYTEVPNPTLRHEHDMLVRLKAAGVNPVDTKLRANGVYFPDNMPVILGCDGAGVVEAVGAEVTRFSAGDEVYFCNGGIGQPQGNYAQYTLVDERLAARKPSSIGFIEAAAAPLVLITAWESLHDRARLQAGQRVLVHAGAGGVGHVAIQLARIAGARICTTVNSDAQAAMVQALGAELAILYRHADFVGAALAWSAQRGVDITLDTVGGTTFEQSIEAMATYGDLVTLLQPPSTMDWKSARLRNLRISLELMLTPMFNHDMDALQHQRRILEQCAQLIDSGQLKISVSDILPLQKAADAHTLLELGGRAGKIVLRIEE